MSSKRFKLPERIGDGGGVNRAMHRMVNRFSRFLIFTLVFGGLPATMSGCGGSYISEAEGTTQAEQPDDDPSAMSDPIVDPAARGKSKR